MKHRKTIKKQKRQRNTKKNIGGGKYYNPKEAPKNYDKTPEREFLKLFQKGLFIDAVVFYNKNKSKFYEKKLMSFAFYTVFRHNTETENNPEANKYKINAAKWLILMDPELDIIDRKLYGSVLLILLLSNNMELLNWVYNLRPNALDSKTACNVLEDGFSNNLSIEKCNWIVEHYPSIVDSWDFINLFSYFLYLFWQNKFALKYLDWMVKIQPKLLNEKEKIDSAFRERFRAHTRQTYSRDNSEILLWIHNNVDSLRYDVRTEERDGKPYVVYAAIREVDDTDKLMYSLSKSGVLNQLDANTVSDIANEIDANKIKEENTEEEW